MVAKLSDEGTSIGDDILLGGMGETEEAGAGVAALGYPLASD